METYKTKDISEASLILSLNIPFIGLEGGDGYYFFVFDDTENACALISQEYWSGKAVGNIKNFVSALKSLKDLIYSRGSKPYRFDR